MARPRVFVSSTYYDLRLIRLDIERFLNELSYDPILFERGHIPYGKDAPMEDYCYREISNCDIVVVIIGGKYGTQSKDQQNSITQNELKTALDLNKQIYIFIEKSVLQEYRTFQANKELVGFKPSAADNIRIYHFIEELYGLPFNNPIEGFESSENIIAFLKEQWVGLFQRLLFESSKTNELKIISDLKATAETLNKTVSFLIEERQNNQDEAINSILLLTHPAFESIKNLANIPYRIAFFNLAELDSLLNARGYELHNSPDKDYFEWDHRKTDKSIHIKKDIFDSEEKLKTFLPTDWKSDFIVQTTIDDDIPF